MGCVDRRSRPHDNGVGPKEMRGVVRLNPPWLQRCYGRFHRLGHIFGFENVIRRDAQHDLGAVDVGKPISFKP